MPPDHPSSARIDVELIRLAISANIIATYAHILGREPSTKVSTSELATQCPFHGVHGSGTEAHPSFRVNIENSFWYCDPCGRGGDAIDLAQEVWGVDFPAAIERLARLLGVAPTEKKTTESPKKEAHLTVVSGGVIRYEIRDADGDLKAVHCRQNFKQTDAKTGKPKKNMWWESPGGAKGLGGVKTTDLPLFGSESLVMLEDGMEVIVTEGEKASLSLTRRFITSVGTVCGQGSCPSDDVLRPLLRFVVILWPDADKNGGGYRHMETIAIRLVVMGGKVLMLDWPDAPDKGDAADFKGSDEEIFALIKAAKLFEPRKQEDWEKARDLARQNRPFTPLGFSVGNGNRKIHHYKTKLSDSITSLTAAQHRETDLYELVEVSWWRAAYPVLITFKNKQTGQETTIASANEVDWTMVKSDLIAESSRAGFVDPGRFTRGVGFWRDGGLIVFHKGDGIIVDGKTIKLGDFVSSGGYEYETRHRVRIGDSAATDQESRQLLEVCNDAAIVWEDKIAGRLFAGWIGIAPLTGGLRWRPHIFLTAGENSGKTTMLIDVAAPSLGGETGGLLHIVGGAQTTEAHIRQSLGNDSKAVIYDEADPNDQRGQQRLRAVQSYMRAANMAGRIGKGSAEGYALSYSVTSIFLTAAISNPIDEAADVRRATVLSLSRPARTDEQHQHWAEFSAKIKKTITPEFGHKLLARLIENAETVLTNVDRYHFALLPKVNDPGMADQLAPLLAGMPFLESTEVIEPADADAEVQALDLSGFTFAAKPESHDEARLFADLMAAKIRVTLEDGRNVRSFSDDRAIGELIRAVRSCRPPADNSEHDALKRIGIKIDPNGDLLIRVRHTEISKLLVGNKWQQNYAAALRRLRTQFGLSGDSKDSGKSARFADGMSKEAVVLPATMLAKLFDE